MIDSTVKYSVFGFGTKLP